MFMMGNKQLTFVTLLFSSIMVMRLQKAQKFIISKRLLRFFSRSLVGVELLVCHLVEEKAR